MGKIVYNGREYLSAGTASTMQGATSTTDGVSGLVPQPLIADKDKVLKGDGTWGDASEIEANPSGTATDTLQKVDIDGVIYDIQGGGGGGSNLILDASIYSTDEKVIGVWVDNRPLYQKSIHLSNVSLGRNESKTIATIANIKLIDGKGHAIEAGIDYMLPEVGFRIMQNGNDIKLQATSNAAWDITDGYVNIKYIKTTDTAGSGGYQAYGFSPIIYSTEEREVGVWTDNKPLYQKTFIITSKQSQIDISSLNIDTYVKSESVYRVGSYCFEMPRLSDTTQNYNAYISTYYAELNSGIIYFLWGTGVSSIDELHFTIQYTKISDVAGSGSYNTLGVPTVHYSTDEQVIGTWIDGKPLYQKTIEQTTNARDNAIVTIDDVTSIMDVKEYNLLGWYEENSVYYPFYRFYYPTNSFDKFTVGQNYGNNNPYNVKILLTIKYTKTTD